MLVILQLFSRKKWQCVSFLHGETGLDKLDQNITNIRLDDGLTETEVLHGGGGPPASCEHTEGLLNTISLQEKNLIPLF